MRTICDVCESAPAVLFCAADEAALCRPCDIKVHMCNKLASRHVRVGLANPSDVPRCDICENATAFFYCEIDGSSLCLQCDMIVHVGGKRTHGRYLLLRQKVEFPGDKPSHVEDQAMQPKDQVETGKKHSKISSWMVREKLQTQRASNSPPLDGINNSQGKRESEMFDLNTRPSWTQAQASNTQMQGVEPLEGSNEDSEGVVPVGPPTKEEMER